MLDEYYLCESGTNFQIKNEQFVNSFETQPNASFDNELLGVLKRNDIIRRTEEFDDANNSLMNNSITSN